MTPDAALRTYAIDPARSEVGFRIGYFGIGSVGGAFTRCTGTVRFVPDDLSTLAGEARVEAASVDTGNAERDRQLRSTHLLGAAQHPVLGFTSTAVRPTGADTFELAGALTVRGVTRHVVLQARYEGRRAGDDGAERVVFSAAFAVSRADYDLRWSKVLESGGFVVADQVDVQVRVEAVAEAMGEAAPAGA